MAWLEQIPGECDACYSLLVVILRNLFSTYAEIYLRKIYTEQTGLFLCGKEPMCAI